MKTDGDKISLGGFDGFDNPLDKPYPKNDYSEGKESARISYRKIWIDRYVKSKNKPNIFSEYWSCELKILSNGKCFLDGKELKQSDDVEAVREIFNELKLE